jgi:hypothetical protein
MLTIPLTTTLAEQVFARALLSLRVAKERNLDPETALAKRLDHLADDCARSGLPLEAYDALHAYTRRAAEVIWPGELEAR